MDHAITSWLEVLHARTLEEARQIADDCLLLAGVATRDKPPKQGYHVDAQRIRQGTAKAIERWQQTRKAKYGRA